ncbi:protein translocase subunit SecF [Alphaproteobacteria bacterium]|nr:protein translocase subunit SecF [Alphaproteobacteria bacterium]
MLIKFIKKTPNLNFIENRKFFFLISGFLSIFSIVFLLIKGLNFGIDFKGGLLIETSFNKNIEIYQLRSKLKEIVPGDFSIQSLDNSKSTYLIKVEAYSSKKDNNQKLISEIKKSLNDDYPSVDYRRLEYVGPTVSKELIKAGIFSILIAVGAMLVYIWFRFELPFAIGAVIALIHDIILTIGMFSISSLEFNLATVAAILLIIGYSMNDTVVVYDRIRENLKKFRKISLISLLNKSVNETLSRTINTTATTILALLALLIFGGNIIKDFSFAMIWGIIIGTYSSILIATPVLIFLNVKRNENKEEN